MWQYLYYYLNNLLIYSNFWVASTIPKNKLPNPAIFIPPFPNIPSSFSHLTFFPRPHLPAYPFFPVALLFILPYIYIYIYERERGTERVRVHHENMKNSHGRFFCFFHLLIFLFTLQIKPIKSIKPSLQIFCWPPRH